MFNLSRKLPHDKWCPITKYANMFDIFPYPVWLNGLVFKYTLSYFKKRVCS